MISIILLSFYKKDRTPRQLRLGVLIPSLIIKVFFYKTSFAIIFFVLKPD